MKISAINKAEPALAPASFQIVEPGLTIGRCTDADLTLAGAQDQVGRIQAIVRTEHGGSYSVENVSATGSVSINGKAIGLCQVAPLQPGDQFDIGEFRLSLEDGTSHHVPHASTLQVPDPDPDPDPVPAPVPDSSPSTTDDLFASLLSGPGVIPVGASTPTLHRDEAPDDILTDPRPTILNRADPLRGQRRDDISEVLERATGREQNLDQENS